MTIEISCKINLKGYESIGITVTGDNRDALIAEIRDVASSLAPNDEETRKMIMRYIGRVFGAEEAPEPEPAPAQKKASEFETANKYEKVCETCGAPLVKKDVDICNMFMNGKMLCQPCRDNLTKKGGK